MNKYYYKCLSNKEYQLGKYKLKPVQLDHIEKIRFWRNEQMDILRQSEPISKSQQHLYFENNVWSELGKLNPKQILFSFLLDSKLIGYGGLVNLSWTDKKAEMSYLIDSTIDKNNSYYDIHMSSFIKLIQNIFFYELNFNKLYTETYDFRKFHIKVLCKNGFKQEGYLKEHIFLNNQYYGSILHSILKKDYNG